jgi:hypothetical protein
VRYKIGIPGLGVVKVAFNFREIHVGVPLIARKVGYFKPKSAKAAA